VSRLRCLLILPLANNDLAAHTGRALLIRRWEQATDRPLMVAAVIFLAAYAVPILAPSLPARLLDLCQWLIWITWGIFAVDIVVRLALADERLRYLIRNWYDVLRLLYRCSGRCGYYGSSRCCRC
jgi:hypothetical protein